MAGPARGGRTGVRATAVVLAATALVVGWVLVLGETHAAWVDGLPGTGAAYGAAVLAIAQLPTLALAAAYVRWRTRSRGGPMPRWWQAAAVLVTSWHLTLFLATFDRKNGRMGSMELAMDPDRFDVAALTLRISCVAFLVAVPLVAALTLRISCVAFLVAVPLAAALREGRRAAPGTSENSRN